MTLTYNYRYDGNDNLLFNPELLNGTTFSYDAANRQVTGVDVSGGLFTNTFDAKGNMTNSLGPTVSATITYGPENNLVVHQQSNTVVLATYSYDSFGKKRTEQTSTLTTLLWDGEDYLQGRS